MDIAVVSLIGITLLAATVNGALGYGFSSLTVPIALLFYTNRVINPALVLVEVAVNSYVLFINRQAIPRVWRRVLPDVSAVPLYRRRLLAGTRDWIEVPVSPTGGTSFREARLTRPVTR